MLAAAAESIVVVVVVIAVVETGLDVGAAVAGRPAAVVVPVHAVFCVDSHDSAWQKSFHRFHI